jgi:hypothetical protein
MASWIGVFLIRVLLRFYHLLRVVVADVIAAVAE